MCEWERQGVDTVHLTFRESDGVTAGEIVTGLADLFVLLGVPGGITTRDRGFHGFENGLSLAGGAQIDWTDLDGGEGPNRGYTSVQIKGDLLDPLGAEESAFLFRQLAEFKPYRASRIDLQITSRLCPTASELIREFRAGRLRVVRKQYFEPKGQELEGGRYPKGATLCHGNRASDNYCRQYDKDKESGEGPPRLRTEVELKSYLAAQAWSRLVEALEEEAQAKQSGAGAEVRLVQELVRNYMPLRDTAEWSGTDLPPKWAGTAPEPAWWAALFDQQAVRLRRERGPSKTLRQAFQHAHRQGGGRFLQELVLEQLDLEHRGLEWEEASSEAQCAVRDRYAMHGNDVRLAELLANCRPEQQDRARELWAAYGKAGAEGEGR